MTAPQAPLALKNPAIAGVLAFLVPGLGHLYQRRFFKAFVFAVCIWGSWWTGMAMSDWKALQAPAKGHAELPVILKYVGQCGVGTPALWALYQADRFYSPDNNSPNNILLQPEDFPFRGEVTERQGSESITREVQGRLFIEPVRGEYGDTMAGRLEGTIDGQPITLNVAPGLTLDAPIRASRAMEVNASLLDDQERHVGQLSGGIP